MEPMFAYFRHTWLERNITIWNMFDILEHRTNNFMEAYHSALKKDLDIHPSLWEFLTDIQLRHVEYEAKVLKIEAGNIVSTRTRYYRVSQLRYITRRTAYVVVLQDAQAAVEEAANAHVLAQNGDLEAVAYAQQAELQSLALTAGLPAHNFNYIKTMQYEFGAFEEV